MAGKEGGELRECRCELFGRCTRQTREWCLVSVITLRGTLTSAGLEWIVFMIGPSPHCSRSLPWCSYVMLSTCSAILSWRSLTRGAVKEYASSVCCH